MVAQEETFDFIIVGSGGGSVPAALVMKERGKSVLIIEKQTQIGGTSAYSGGVIWIPNNDHLNAAGGNDSHERSRTYFDTMIGPPLPSSSYARRDAWIREGAEMIRFLERKGMKFVHAHWPDYYCERPGGILDGRSLAAPLFNIKELGEWAPKLAAHPMTSMLPLASPESVALFTATKTLRGKWIAMKVAFRKVKEKLLGQTIRGAGNALQGRLFQIAFRENVPIWTETPVKDFVVENGRVVGVIAEREGRTIQVRARLGVLVNAGGFSRNLEMREKYQPKPTSVNWTQVNPGDTGEMIQAIMKLGAATDQLDESFWLACSFLPDGTTFGFHSPNDIGKPHAIVVDNKGKRFTNESSSYMEFGQKMYAAGAVPAWAIFDSRHRRYYPWGGALPGVTPKSLIESGYMKKADTLDEIARLCGVDPAGLAQTVERFNGFVRKGVDEDFHRGASGYNHYYGDPTVKPNPNLGTLEKAPFYAVAIYPGDVGTCGGIVADEHARALRPDGSPIPGLYVTGNTSAAAGGRVYMGAGASVGPSMTFGYIAARHAAGANQ
ncbi:MAG: FAD-binding protein [Rhodospirillaceae bacterium]|nr:MAG: FAD-binding protein [Rhodospirillaceae bacterium]